MSVATCVRCGQPTKIKEIRKDEGSVVLSCGCKMSATNLALMGRRIGDDGKTLEAVKGAVANPGGASGNTVIRRTEVEAD